MTDETIDNETGEVTEFPSPPDDPKDVVREARELVQVTAGGVVNPTNLAEMIEFAKAMSRARWMIPEHMHDNVGDCLMIFDLATRAGLFPSGLAMMTYVEPKSKRLSFMSQAFHALASPWLKGEFVVHYDGEGEDRTCTVSGILKADPGAVRSHTSPKLKDVRPKRNAEGVIKGSPLWDRKPDVQLFYDTSRDWVRIYCPRATMGIYMPDELADYGPDFARDVTPGAPGLGARLRGGKVSKIEGHRDGEARKGVQAAKNGGDRTPAKPAKPTTGHDNAAGKPPKAAAPSTKATAKRIRKRPTNPKEWEAYCRAWLAEEADSHEIELRWKGERNLRNECGVDSETRAPVEQLKNERLKELQAGA